MSDMKPVEEYKILDETSLEKIRTLSVYYSKRSQLSKAKEELRELLDELEKAPNPFDFEDLVFITDNTWSEVADVFIMLMQLIMQHESAEKVSEEINYKLNRQFNRISKENIPEWKEKMLNILFLTQWIELSIDANGENLVISDEKFPGSFPEGAAIRPDGTVRPFVAMAKYMAADNDDGVASSITGRNAAHNQSHNGMITRFHNKGTQYCGTTAQDKSHMDNLFLVAFATRNTQSVMAGCTSYYYQYAATIQESNVERIIISKSQAANLVVGSVVSVGNATSLTSGTPNIDRSYDGMHSKANRVKIVSIEDYDGENSIVNIDNGGQKFSTAPTVVDDVPCPTYISTMPWMTGTCDNVLASCGSPVSNTNGKYPCVLFGVEMFIGFWEIIANVIMKITNHVMIPYICYDCTKLATSVTADYKAVGYSVADTQQSYKYISKLGYDPDNPCVRHGVEVNATSSTGYADGQYTEKLDQAADATRAWFSGGALDFGTGAGRFYATLNHALSYATWNRAARLSASGRCAQKATA